MPNENNKNVLRRYIEEVWDKSNIDAIDEFLSPDSQRHRSPNLSSLNRTQQKELLIAFKKSFPDAQITVEDMISGADRIAFRSIIKGTHKGEFLDIRPTGKQIEVSLLDIIRIEDGKFVEQWGGPDIHNLL